MAPNISILNAKHDKDGRLYARQAITQQGGSLYYGGPLVTLASTTVEWAQITPEPPFSTSDRGWCTVTLYDATGNETTSESLAAYTVVDIIPQKDIDLVSASVRVPPTLPAGNSDFHYSVWAYAAPKIPASLGGQIPFVEDIELEQWLDHVIVIDGKVPKYMRYLDVSNDPNVQAATGVAPGSGWYENHIRVIFRHPTGLTPSTDPTTEVKFDFYLHMYIKW